MPSSIPQCSLSVLYCPKYSYRFAWDSFEEYYSFMASPDPQIVLKLAADMVAAKEHLEALQAKWDSLFATGAAPPASAPVPRVPGRRPPNSKSLTGRIISLLDEDPTVHYEASEIARALGEPQDKVQRTINKLVFHKKIGRYSRGMYESIIQV
jgi:hypothetical protein